MIPPKGLEIKGLIGGQMDDKAIRVLNQLHAVSRTQQGRQREPSLKMRSPLSAEFWRHCVLSVGTQRRALPRHQSEEMQKYKCK